VLRHTPIIRPVYSDDFHCIGPACEDSCCVGWTVNIDRATYEKYRTIPESPLRSLVDANVLRKSPDAAAQDDAAYASIRMTQSRECPFLTEERLCRIQAERGESYLSHTCANFPRAIYFIDGVEDKTLTLACPEAARLILLNPNLLASRGTGGYQFNWDDAEKTETSLRFLFWPIREFSIGLIRNRAFPLWQRMFLLGTFSRRLEALANGPSERGFVPFLRDFTAAVKAGSLQATMETIPADLPLQLDLVLELVKLNVGGLRVSPRFNGVLEDFAAGVGYGRETALAGQSALYASAYRTRFVPFFQKHPHILENYLLNALFRGLFPFGQKLMDPQAQIEPARNFALLAIQFALVKGLLIGVAGAKGEAFSLGDVVQTVQCASKHFDHNPDFLDRSYRLLASRELDNARGLTMLLRN
jgi:lysine-N-methylase